MTTKKTKRKRARAAGKSDRARNVDWTAPHSVQRVLTKLRAELRAAREAQGLSLREMGASTGCSHAQVSHHETGRSKPTLEWLLTFANATGIGACTLLKRAGA